MNQKNFFTRLSVEEICPQTASLANSMDRLTSGKRDAFGLGAGGIPFVSASSTVKNRASVVRMG